MKKKQINKLQKKINKVYDFLRDVELGLVEIYQESKVEKKEKPEYIRVIDNTNTSFKLNEIVKATGFIKLLQKSKWEPATKADYEAHKLGFHVGDEVWLNTRQLDRLTPIINFFKDERYGFCARFKSGSFEQLKNLTKTPPKKAIFQINGVDKFKDEKFYFLDKNYNWRLHELVVDRQNSGNYSAESYFNTKQEALEYVLQEAKERFKGCKLIKFINNGETEKPKGEIKIEDCETEIGYSGSYKKIWDDDDGWIAQPIKETPLMLGDDVVSIEKRYTQPVNPAHNYIWVIKCKGESVTKEEWMEWYEKFKIALENTVEFANYLGTIRVKYFHGLKVDIGHIEDASIEQIEEITKALNEL